MPEKTPRAVISDLIRRRVLDPVETLEALQALAALRDPPAEPPGAAWTAPDEKAVKRHG